MQFDCKKNGEVQNFRVLPKGRNGVFMRSYFTVTICAALMFSGASFGAEEAKSKTKKTEEHREHGAHEHGAGTLGIAFDDLKGKVEFKAAAKPFLGFEHEPRTDEQKKVWESVAQKFEKDISSMIQFDPKLECKFVKEKIAFEKEEEKEDEHHDQKEAEHGNLIANFNVICQKTVVGSKVKIHAFPFVLKSHAKEKFDIDVTILAGNVQKSAELGKKAVTLEIK